MIRVEDARPGSAAEEPAVKLNELLCQKCRYLATSKGDLTEHLSTHKEDILVDPEAEDEIKVKRGRKAG